MPLVWAHSEFLKLLHARAQGRPIELLTCVETHLRARRRLSWHWRADAPFEALAAERDLLIDLDQPFLVHFGFDGWQDIEDRRSSPLPFGRHGVRLSRGELAGHRVVDFALYFPRQDRWQGVDFNVQLPARPRAELSRAPQDEVDYTTADR